MQKPKIIAQVLAYNEGDCIEQAVKPWIPYCERIDILEGAFLNTVNLGYSNRSTDGTCKKCEELSRISAKVKVQHHFFANEPILRNHHLWDTAKTFGRDGTVLFILDADEIYSVEEIEKCLAQIEKQWNEYNTWWVNFKNYVNNPQTYYLGFHVPRFFKMEQARGFSGYNDVAFSDGVKDTDINGILPKHYSWLPFSKSKRKIQWQQAIGWEPSWKIENESLVINEDYYAKTGKEKPVILIDEPQNPDIVKP